MKSKIVLGLSLILFLPALRAGTTCEQVSNQPELYINASRMAIEAQKKLDKLDAQVVLIARVGADLRKYGLRYSHVGFAVKKYPGMPGKWTIVHLLNGCNTSTSRIYAQGLMNFFMDDLYSL